MKKIKILIVALSDEIQLFQLKESMEKENYSVAFISENEHILRIAEEALPVLIIICLNNDSKNIDLCFRLREIEKLSRTLIFIVSDKKDTYLQVIAHNSGADDYIEKPLNVRTLHYKIKSLLKRVFDHSDTSPKAIAHGSIRIDREKYLLTDKHEREIELPRKEFDILSLLMTEPKKVFLRKDIITHVWREKLPGNTNRALDVHIRRIRIKIGVRHIKMIKGVGYSFHP